MSCFSFSKYILLIFNFIIFLAGGTTMGFGVYLKVAKQPNQEVLDKVPAEVLSVGATMLIAVGAIMFVIAFLGCCGACKESQCLLSMYLTLLIIAFAFQIGIVIYSAVKTPQAATSLLPDNLEDEVIKEVQKWFRCCGTQNTTCSGFEGNVPKFCECDRIGGTADCKKLGEIDTCSAPSSGNSSITNETLVYSTACPEAIENYVTANAKVLLIVLGVIVALEIFGIIFSMIVCCKVRNGEDILC